MSERQNDSASSLNRGDSTQPPSFSAVADEFMQRFRDGEQPTMADYVEEYPQLADQIREVFPMLRLMEQVSENPAPTTMDADAVTRIEPRQHIGQYCVVREIGCGGMGVVYEAEHLTLSRRVALKMLPTSAAAGKNKERFFREARAAARLHHTNIVPVFDFGEDNGSAYYAMQYIEGWGLDKVVQRNREQSEDGRSSSSTAFWAQFGSAHPKDDSSGAQLGKLNRWTYIARLGMQAAEALHYAHSQGVVHRDIKPSNLLLDDAHHVWITDFGLAKLADERDLTATGELVGTLRYLAPESLRGASGKSADVYGLGLVLYELIVLRRPFDDSDRLTLVQRITEKGPTPIGRLRKDVPRDLQMIVQKARAPRSRDPLSSRG